MQVSVENAQGLERTLKISVPSDRVEGEIQKRLKSMAPRVKISGFRPGKVPFSVIQKRYGGQVRQEVVGEVINSSFFEAVAKENMRPAGMPKIESQNDNNDGFEFTASFEVYPEIEIKDVDKIKIERDKADILDTDIDKMVQKLREQRSEWRTVDRPAKDGDRLNTDYRGTVDGEVFDGGEGSDLSITLGSKGMIEGFEAGLVGASVGDTVEMDLKFPDPYHGKELAGKDVHFSVTIKTIEEPVLPEINEEFAKSFGIEDGDVEKLRADLKKNMQRELENTIRSKVRNKVMDQLLEKIQFEVPNAMIEQEAQRLVKQMQDQMKGGAAASAELKSDGFKDQAKRRVSLGLILAEIIKINDIKAAPEKVRAEIQGIASAYGEPDQVLQWYYQDKNRLQEVESVVLENEVIDWVLETAQVTDNMTTFDEIMNPAAT